MRLAAKLIGLGFGAALLNGCASNPPSLAGGTSVETSANQASGSAFPGANASAKTETAGFNPFGDPSGPAPGGREVILNPTIADIMKPAGLPEMALGRADAPVTIVQYASLTCPHCRQFHKETYPVLKRDYIDTGKVRYILREFPIGRASGNATIALRCAKPEKYFELYGKYMEQQTSWVSQEVRLDPIFAVAQQSGLTRAEFDACLKNDTLIGQLNGVKEHGRKLGIIGTPNFFVQGKLVKSELTISEIRTMVDPILAGSPAAVAGR